MERKLKVAIVGAGPVGSLAALYAANRGHSVEIYELRAGAFFTLFTSNGRRLRLHIVTAAMNSAMPCYNGIWC